MDGGEPFRSKKTWVNRGAFVKVVMGDDDDDDDAACWRERERDSRFVNSTSEREKRCAS